MTTYNSENLPNRIWTKSVQSFGGTYQQMDMNLRRKFGLLFSKHTQNRDDADYAITSNNSYK
jgi:hypothetical protein